MQDFCLMQKEEFFYEKHVKYLLKSLKPVTSGHQLDLAEAHRLSSLFFVVSGLDLLGVLDTRLTQSDKDDIIEWIYSYQVNIHRTQEHSYTTGDESDERGVGHAGFRATSMIDSGIPLDCGIITMTYCALATLVILGDDLERVDKKSIIAGIRHLQLYNGSFIPSILGGESDMRLVYCAVAVSSLLNDWSGLDRDKCAGFIKESLSYEGSFGQCPGAEAHGGSTYCALASLKMMSKLDDTLNSYEIDKLARWCINRLDNGFSGRPNKDQDTCYSFWIGACLVILDHYKYIEQTNLVEFLLLAQEERGGLSKVPAFYSDPLHTYLGFAGLTFVDDELCAAKRVQLLKLDPLLMMSTRAKAHLEELHETWKRDVY